MTAEARLAAVYVELGALGVERIVMGGHAVRFHGVDRSTVDYDVAVALEPREWASLGARLSTSSILGGPALREGHSWRPDDFRRFVLGALPDGREERLEFWRRNHLLSPFPDLWSRRAEGPYGGARVAFLGIDDLIRSKETEREDDWRDVALLEEIADERRLAAAASEEAVVAALGRLRSRRGFERTVATGLFADAARVSGAARAAAHAVTCAYLAPFPPAAPAGEQLELPAPVRELLRGPLRRVEPASARHLALVEAVRRLCRSAAMAADRADKQAAAGRT